MPTLISTPVIVQATPGILLFNVSTGHLAFYLRKRNSYPRLATKVPNILLVHVLEGMGHQLFRGFFTNAIYALLVLLRF